MKYGSSNTCCGSKFLSYLICIYIFLMPLIPYKAKIKNIPISGDMVLLLVFLVYFISFITSRDTRRRFKMGIYDFFHNGLSISMVILLLIMFLSVGYAKERSLALSESLRFSTYVILYFIIKYECNLKRYITSMIKSFIGVSFLLSVMGIIQGFTGIGLEGKFVRLGYSNYSIAVTMDNPNWYAPLIILILFPAVMLAIYERNKKLKIFYSVLSVLLFANMLMTYSRNALVGFGVGFAAFSLFFGLKILVPLIGTGVILLFIPSVNSRIKDIFNSSQNSSRLNLWRIGAKMIKDHPILGVGNGNYRSYYDEYVAKFPEYSDTGYTRYACHNSYLKVQSELGIGGIIAFVSTLIFAVIKLFNFAKNTTDRFYKSFYMGYTVSAVAYIFMSISDNLFFLPKDTVFFWILLAIAESYKFNQSNSYFKG